MNEAVLRDAAREVRDAMLASLPPECPHYEASPAFERRMGRLLHDPAGYAKKMLRPWYEKALHTAAMAAVAAGLSLFLISQVSPTAWAAVKQWFMEIRASDIVYYFTGEARDEELPYYTITELPEGYVPTGEVIELTGYRSTTYMNADGTPLYFDYGFMHKGSAHGVDTGGMEVYDITVNGCPGQMFLSLDPAYSNGIVWTDEKANIQFSINAYAEDTVLLHMAESVSLCKTENP